MNLVLNPFRVKNKEIDNCINDALCALRDTKATIKSLMIFPNISPLKMDIKKEIWTDIPTDYASGVKTMGLHLSDEYYSVLCKYEPHSEIQPHYHENMNELIYVLDGAIIDKHKDAMYLKGDTVMIKNKQSHHITTGGMEAYLYIVFSKDLKYLHVHDNDKKRFNKILITN